MSRPVQVDRQIVVGNAARAGETTVARALQYVTRHHHGDPREATVVPGTQVPTLEAGPGITLDAAPQA